MALTLIGLGLFDDKDLSLRAVEESKKSDLVCIELYTGKWYGDISNLQKLIGKEIVQLKRKDLEENSKKILEEAKNKRVAIFIIGDPLIATTHISLILDARRLGIETKIIHNSSIVSAIGETGLHAYKFGPIVTIPFKEKTKGKSPQSIFEIIKDNKKRGLHTLCLLDVVADENRYMTISNALQILLSGNIISQKDKMVAFSKAGSDKPAIVYDTVKNLIGRNIADVPSVLIIPGKLHFTEEEFLENL